MTVYVFGNNDVPRDTLEIKIIKPNDDVEFDSRNPVILDTVEGIRKIKIFRNIDEIQKIKSSTVHDFDLGFQLKYLKKIGKIDGATIIGVPMKSSKS
ncbi:MAG: hypothetical protein AAB838_04235 [Patescibacteria group bacterium]